MWRLQIMDHLNSVFWYNLPDKYISMHGTKEVQGVNFILCEDIYCFFPDGRNMSLRLLLVFFNLPF